MDIFCTMRLNAITKCSFSERRESCCCKLPAATCDAALDISLHELASIEKELDKEPISSLRSVFCKFISRSPCLRRSADSLISASGAAIKRLSDQLRKTLTATPTKPKHRHT